MELVRAAYVIARRDFTATVFTKTFLFFLLTPLLFIGVGLVFGNLTEKMAKQDMRANVAVIATEAQFAPMAAARTRLETAFRSGELVELVRVEPDYVVDSQVKELLGARDKRVLAVLTGGLAQPTLTGAISKTGSIRSQIGLIVSEARQQTALSGAGVTLPPPEIAFVRVDESAGSLARMRSITARTGQLLLFMLTVLLATMLLSNLVEEKTNKVLEVLAAAVPVNAIFLGKLFSMLAVSVVGIVLWGAAVLVGLALFPVAGSGMPAPAVGWPLFVLLVMIYYTTNYLLLGALFLGIGSQASSIREVQTMSMPVTIGQMLVFLFASVAVGPFNSLIGIAAAIFPFSSPLAMIARAAQTPELWPHLLAIAWQVLWVWLTVQLAASMFRRNAMKSGASGTSPSFGLRRKKPA